MSAHQDDEWFSFEANFEGHEPQEFITLQDAFNYAEWCGARRQSPGGGVALLADPRRRPSRSSTPGHTKPIHLLNQRRRMC